MKYAKKLAVIEEPVKWAYVYKMTDGKDEYEGTVKELTEHFNLGSTNYLTQAIYRAKKWRSKEIKYRHYTLYATHLQSTERIYEVINEQGEKVQEGSVAKLAACYGYPINTIKTYCSNRHYMVIRRKKYYFRPIDKWNLIWRPLD